MNQVNIDDQNIININPKSIVVIVDATFFGRSYGVIVFREPNLKKNLIWQEIFFESPENYLNLKLILDNLGFTIKAVVLDGKRGIRQVFSGIPTQMCQFHQIAIVNRYLTRRPKLIPSIQLRKITLSLTITNEQEFSKLLNSWYKKWQFFLKEKTFNPNGHWFYTHKRIRSAYRSLKTNLPHLFTYQKYPELKIPNTTNSLDGSFTSLKNLLRIHRGMNKSNRYKMICQILKNTNPK